MHPPFSYTICPLGDSAILLQFGNSIDQKINQMVMALHQELEARRIPGVVDIVPAYSSLALHYNISEVKNESTNINCFTTISRLLQKIMGDFHPTGNADRKIKRVPVCYSKSFAPDIEVMMNKTGLSHQQIIDVHISKRYSVHMLGFLPGFAYMGEVDPGIAVDRKDQPRTLVEAGSVGIAGKQTGIYPFDSPGGWQIIGKTPLTLFDKDNNPPALFEPGDQVEFYSITENEFENYQGGDL